MAEIGLKVFESVGDNVSSDVVYSGALDYILHIESLYELPLPKLKVSVSGVRTSWQSVSERRSK